MTTLTLTEKLHAQQIRKRLLNGYPPQSAFCELMAHITDEELLRQERAAHQEKLAWLAVRRAERESPFNKIIKKAMSE
jgi:pyruvate dehydrogenase complex dehydrogenase (E1) component